MKKVELTQCCCPKTISAANMEKNWLGLVVAKGFLRPTWKRIGATLLSQNVLCGPP